MRIIRFISIIAVLGIVFLGGVFTEQVHTFPYQLIARAQAEIFGASIKSIKKDGNREILTALYRSRPTDGIVIIGDSHVQYGDWARLSGRDDIFNEGIASETSGEVLDRLSGVQGKLSQVVVLAGTNDIDYLSLADTTRNFSSILETLKNRSVPAVFLAPPLMVDERRNGPLSSVISAERTVCESAPGMCTFVDCNSVLSPNGKRRPDTALDGIHLSATGYDDLYRCLAPHLTAPIQ